MKVTRTRTHRFQLAKYEHIEISASIEDDVEALTNDVVLVMDATLDRMLRDDIARAEVATSFDTDDTYLHTWKELTEES